MKYFIDTIAREISDVVSDLRDAGYRFEVDDTEVIFYEYVTRERARQFGLICY